MGVVSEGACRVQRESFTDREVRALIAHARQNERERCATRINALIEGMGSPLGARRWYAARLSALMAAKSAVMRGDDSAPPV